MTDVLIVGAGPAGLMLAGELCLAGVRPLVLERRSEPWEGARAGGLGGQILGLLRMRGELERFEAAAHQPLPAPRFPYGGVHLDFTGLEDAPMRAIGLPQARLERLLADRARELGAEIRHGHELTGLRQDEHTVTAEVRGPAGAWTAEVPYLVGCDGPRSRVRELAGIGFPGTTYPEVNRIGRVTVPCLDGGELDIPGRGRMAAGFTRTDTGVFAFGPAGDQEILVSVTLDEEDTYDDDTPMTLAELGHSIRRVLGAELPMTGSTRLSRFTFKARQASAYRSGRVFVAGDAAHLFPATGVALNAGLLDTVNLAWKLAAAVRGSAPAGLLDTYHAERHLAGARTLLHTQAQVALRRGLDPAADALREIFQELVADEQPLRRMGALLAGDVRYPGPGTHPLAGTFWPGEPGLLREGRPVLLGPEPVLAEAAEWKDRVDLRPSDRAVLLRPDGHVAWADGPGLREALAYWF
ncbi:FAD-dependent monooxygenase [Symbioplanes lichenis]|uniref:FAD-dependent monooxygenase n=1 Tax=Symbioplanes lichenis TaxID=1629072 RepID=UPI00273834FC|nr:FAD-dependent monooxygenase [Actinoplanes lichenis]